MKVSASSKLRVHLQRIHSEYLEMPGLRLTAAQARRLLDLDATTCQVALDALVETRFLRLTADGVYVRLTEGAVGRRDVA